MPALQDSINAVRVAAEAADRIKDCPAIDLELAHPETAEHAEDAAVTTA